MDRRLLAAILVVGILGAFLRLVSQGVERRTPDERVYAHYASVLAERGLQGTRELVQRHHADEKRWIYPTPIRVGYLYPLAALMKVTQTRGEETGAWMSCAFSILTLGLLGWMAIRFFDGWVALGSLLLLSVSPLDLAMARRAWQESMLAFFALILVYFCCEITVQPERRRWYVLFWVAGAYALTIKEGSSWLLYGLLVVWVLWGVLRRKRSLSRVLVTAAWSALVPLAGVAILAAASGGVSDVAQVIRHNTGSIATNQYAIAYQNGPWYSFVHGLWMLTPATLVLAGIAVVGTFRDRRLAGGHAGPTTARPLVGALALFIVVFTAILSFPSHYKNLRYIAVVFGPLYLLSGVGLGRVVGLVRASLSPARARLALVAVLLVVVIAAVTDYRRFRHLFVEQEVPDLVNRSILEARRSDAGRS